MKKEIMEKASKIKLLLLDVDGVLTNGGITLDNDGGEMKTFHVRDGHGIKMLSRAGIQVGIITGRSSRVVERRAKELGIKEVYQKCFDKTVAYKEILEKLGLKDEETAYVGDDIVDIPLFVRVGLPIAVADAAADAKLYAIMTTENPGGRGAVREVTDLILKAQGLWNGIIENYAKI